MSPYDLNVIKKAVKATWETPDDFYVLSYPPVRRGDAVTSFVLDFKENKSGATAIALDIMVEQLENTQSELRDKRQCRYIVCIPGHEKGFGSIAGDSMCRDLSARYPWLVFLEGALERTKTVPKAARAKRGERTNYEKHVETIRFNDSALRKSDEGIIMFDDVYTKGDTSRACRDIIRRATKCSSVTGLFLSRTN